MGKNNSKPVIEKNNTVIRKRMYKSKGHWNVATTGMVALGAVALGGVVTDQQAQADEVTQGDSSIQAPSYDTTTDVAPTVNSANTDIANAYTTSHNAYENVGATLDQASNEQVTVTNDNANEVNNYVASDASRQVETINTAGAVNNDIYNAIQSATPVTEAVGGSIDVNVPSDATNASVDEIRSHGTSQVQNINAVGDANTNVSMAVANNSQAVSDAGGVLRPGKPIDASSMTPEEISASASRAVDMLNATGSADSKLMSASTEYTDNITRTGGTLTKSGEINTADNMTVADVDASVNSQIVRISATASANDEVYDAVSKASSVVSNVGGVLSAGASIDTTKLTSEELASIVAHQSQMISATADADDRTMNAVSSASKHIVEIGGTIKKDGDINTADNMTASQVQSMAISQAENITETGEGDKAIKETVDKNKDVISNAGGTLTSGGVIDVTGMTGEEIKSLAQSQVTNIDLVGSHDSQVIKDVNSAKPIVSGAGGVMTPGKPLDVSSMTPEEIKAEAQKQSAMISATADADQRVSDAVNSGRPDIEGIGGTITNDGTVNTADNMTPEDVNSHVVSQEQKISNTASADRVISEAVKNNRGSIEIIGGVAKPGEAIDVTDMTSDEIKSIAQHQKEMVDATGSADTVISNTVDTNRGDIEAIGGTITNDGTINTADDMTVEQISQSVQSQKDKIENTASADRVISEAVKNNRGSIEIIGGVAKPGEAIDVTNMTSDEIKSIAQHQKEMVDATGSADTVISNTVDTNRGDIEAIGGTITNDGTINTADDMTVDQISQSVQSQRDKIENTASADRVISEAVKNNRGSIEIIGGVAKPGEAIDVTDMTSDEIKSIAQHQKEMVDATGSADVVISNAVSDNTDAITNAGGTITNDGTINTADDMTVDQISQSVQSQKDNIDATGSADTVIKDHQDKADVQSKPFGGSVVTGESKDASGMSVDEIKSFAQSQADKIDAVGNNNQMLSDTEVKVSDVVNAIGGKVSKGDVIDVSGMSTEEIKSMAEAQNATLSAVGEGDRIIGSALTNNMNNIQNAGGKILSAGAINMAGKTPEEILNNANSQASNIIETGQGDYNISNAVNSTKSTIENYGGSVTRNPESDVSGLSGSQIKSMADEQVDNLNGTKDATDIVSNAEQNAKSDVLAFGGTLTKGQPVDVSGMTSTQIKSMVQHQADILKATADGDKKLSQVFDQTNGDISAIGGKIIKGSTNTASMSVDEINAQVQKQVENMQNVASGDKVLSNGIANNNGDISAVGGTITKRDDTNAKDWTADQINASVQSQVTNMQNVASGDRELKDGIDKNKDAINNAGGTLTSRASTDATNMSADEINANIQSQKSNMSATAMGDNVLSTAESRYSETTTRGSASDVTGLSSEAIADFVSSQTTSVGATNNAYKAIQVAVNSANGTISGIGGQIAKAGTVVDTTHMSAESMADIVNKNIGKLEATSSADGQLTQAVNNNSSAITANGGTLTQNGEIWTTDMPTSAIKESVDQQVNKINAVGSADMMINNAINNNRDVAIVSKPVDVGNMNQDQIRDYANSVAQTLERATSANNQLNDLASQLNNLGGKANNNGYKTVNNADQIGQSAQAGIDALNSAVTAQTSANSMRDATNSANTSIDSMAKSASDAGLNVNWDQTITVHNADELASVVAMNNQRLSDIMDEFGTVSNIRNNYPTEPKYNADKYTDRGTFQLLNYNGENNNIGGTGTVITFKDGVNPLDKRSVGDSIQVYSSNIDKAHIISHIYWGDEKPEAISGSITPGRVPNFSYNTNADGSTTQEYRVTNHSIVKFPGIVTTADGKKHDLIVKFDISGDHIHSQGDDLMIWNQNKAINSGYPSDGVVPNQNYNFQTYRIDNWDNKEDYLFTTFVSDIDVAQKQDLGSSYLLGIGGGLNAWGAHEGNNLSVLADLKLPDLSAMASYPDGVILTAYYGSSWEIGLGDWGSKQAYSPMVGYFGEAGSVSPTVVDTNISLAKVNYDWQPISLNYDTYNTEASVLSATYTPYSVVADTDWNYTTTPLSTTYSALSTTYSPLSTEVDVLSDNGGYTPFVTDYTIYSTSFNALSDEGGYNPQMLKTTPLSTKYKSYSTDGTDIPPVIPDGEGGWKVNPKFTGYAPLSTKYKSYSTDGTDIPPVIPDGEGGWKVNPKFTGYAPLSTKYKSYSTDGTDIPPVIPDGEGGWKVNPKFTGYAPLSTKYKSYSSDGENVPDGNNFTGYRPLSTKYNALSTTYKSFSSDGSKIPPTLPDGSPNPNFTGFTSFSTTYSPYSSDGQNVPDGHNFTGYAPYKTTYTPLKASYKFYEPVNNITPDVVPAEPVRVTPVSQPQVQPAPKQAVNVLPQMGDTDSTTALIGVAMVAFSLGFGLVGRKKRDLV